MVFEKSEMEYLIENNCIFSEAKKELFKKACELSILNGARVCVVGFNPAGNPFAFGSPSVDAVINEYLRKGQELEGELSRQNVKPSENGKIKKLYKQLRHVTKRIRVEEKKSKKINNGNFPFILDDLDFEELRKVKDLLEKLKDDVKVAASLLLPSKKHT